MPPSRRRQRDPAIVAYAPGGPKIFYTTLATSRPYLAALVNADVLFDSGLKELPHGLTDKQYSRILTGDFSEAPLAIEYDITGAPDDAAPQTPSALDDSWLLALEEALRVPPGSPEIEDGLETNQDGTATPLCERPGPPTPIDLTAEIILRDGMWGVFRFTNKTAGEFG